MTSNPATIPDQEHNAVYNRRKNGQFASGNHGGPGRPVGSIDRVRAVEEAICRKMGEKEASQEGVIMWLKTLPDHLLAPLYAKLLPRDDRLRVEGHLTLDQLVGRLQARREADEDEEGLENG